MALLGFVQNFLTKREGVREYIEKLRLFLADSHLSDNEKVELNNFATKYGLTEKDLEKLHKLAIGDFFKNISSDQRITEDERQSLNTLLNYFRVDLKGGHFDQKTFNKYYILGLIDSGVLPEISSLHHDVNIQFKNGEVLHFATTAILRKHKTITKKINYGGLSTSIKICKGVRYRVGSINVARQTQQILAAEDTGIFYFTNQRIGFLGSKKQFSFPYSKIQSFDLRDEGLFVFKDGKEAAYILTIDDYEVPCAIVSYMLNR